MINKSYVGEGNVYLLAGGGRYFSSVAAKFCRAGLDKDVMTIYDSPDSEKIVKSLVESRHMAALEFDKFIFGVEGYSRVTEVQLVRKRLASYMISSGRVEKHGTRPYDVVIPKSLDDVSGTIDFIDPSLFSVTVTDVDRGLTRTIPLRMLASYALAGSRLKITVTMKCNTNQLLSMLDQWYSRGVELGVPEEELRYMKPQATAFRACIMMDAANLRNWAMIRMCNRAQTEIRDLCTKMINLASEAAPTLFEGVGPTCKALGYCPETEQCAQCKGKVPTKAQVTKYVAEHIADVLKS